MAIEDAQILASSLSKKHLHASKKLDSYKKIRFPRTKKIQFLQWKFRSMEIWNFDIRSILWGHLGGLAQLKKSGEN